MTKQEIYQSKLIMIEEALSKIKSGDVISLANYGNEPAALLSQLHTIADRVENVTVWMQLPTQDYPFFSDNSLKGRIDMRSVFYGGGLREAHKVQRVTLVPGTVIGCGDADRKPAADRLYGGGYPDGSAWLCTYELLPADGAGNDQGSGFLSFLK